VDARGIAFALGLAAICATGRAEAEADRPVFVTVVGRGAIRLRIAAGVTAPCDSSENRMLFDGWVGPGRYRWETRASFVCYQHTAGALRELDWSESRLVPTTMKRSWRPMEILVSTD
jgi:hypothetical protein